MLRLLCQRHLHLSIQPPGLGHDLDPRDLVVPRARRSRQDALLPFLFCDAGRCTPKQDVQRHHHAANWHCLRRRGLAWLGRLPVPRGSLPALWGGRRLRGVEDLQRQAPAEPSTEAQELVLSSWLLISLADVYLKVQALPRCTHEPGQVERIERLTVLYRGRLAHRHLRAMSPVAVRQLEAEVERPGGAELCNWVSVLSLGRCALATLRAALFQEGRTLSGPRLLRHRKEERAHPRDTARLHGDTHHGWPRRCH
mmetsp:Transcript_61520/g.135233  ORF Transcript_61520/g.135233 Transcript_61520/m.135233 type:complete len:254 (+) Transcript_61520:162-923(+)